MWHFRADDDEFVIDQETNTGRQEKSRKRNRRSQSDYKIQIIKRLISGRRGHSSKRRKSQDP